MERNLNHDHLFVVIRLDEPSTDIARSEFVEAAANYVTSTKAFSSEAEAIAEATRLNELNSDKQCRYIVRLARFPRR